MKNWVLVFSLIAGPLALWASHALAIRSDVTMASITQENRTMLVHINGSLSCITDVNIQQECALRITEANTGRVFRLENVTTAMQLFDAGKKTVTIEGTLANHNIIKVSSARAL